MATVFSEIIKYYCKSAFFLLCPFQLYYRKVVPSKDLSRFIYLFIYMNYLPDVVEHSKILLLLYADDAKLFRQMKDYV